MQFDGGPLWDSLFWICSQKLTWVPLYLLLVYLIYRKYGLRQTGIIVIFIVLMVTFADQTANIFKTYTPKFRPSHTPELEGLVHSVNGYVGGLYGTVSAHSAISFGIATFSYLILSNRWLIVMFFWAALVAYSRIYLGVHFPMDLLFGAIEGAFWAFVTYNGYLYISKRCAQRSKHD